MLHPVIRLESQRFLTALGRCALIDGCHGTVRLRLPETCFDCFTLIFSCFKRLWIWLCPIFRSSFRFCYGINCARHRRLLNKQLVIIPSTQRVSFGSELGSRIMPTVWQRPPKPLKHKFSCKRVRILCLRRRSSPCHVLFAENQTILPYSKDLDFIPPITTRPNLLKP